MKYYVTDFNVIHDSHIFALLSYFYHCLSDFQNFLFFALFQKVATKLQYNTLHILYYNLVYQTYKPSSKGD